MSHRSKSYRNLSRSELEDYEDDCYRNLKKGYYEVKISDTVYRCPYCREKRKEDYRFRDLLRHARQGSSSWDSKLKAKHLALERYMKKYLNVETRVETTAKNEFHSVTGGDLKSDSPSVTGAEKYLNVETRVETTAKNEFHSVTGGDLKSDSPSVTGAEKYLNVETRVETTAKNECPRITGSDLKSDSPSVTVTKADQLFVWPWVGIVANIQRKREGGRLVGESGKNIKEELTGKGFNPMRVHPLWNHGGHSGFAIVEFQKDWAGFNNAMEFEKYFEVGHRGKKDYYTARQRGAQLYGWIARDDDYNQGDLIGDHLRKKGDLKTVSDKQAEDSRREKKLESNLKNTLEDRSKRLKEMESKFNETDQSVDILVNQKDEMLKAYNEEITKMQKNARDHMEKIFVEHEKVTSHLEAQKKQLEQHQKQLEQREVNNENERKKLQRLHHDMEMNKQATLEQKKADEKVLKLADDHKKAKEDLHTKILELEKKLDAKQTLELEIERMRGALQVMKHMGGGDDDILYKQKMEKIEEDLKEKVEELEGVEALNQTLIIKERKTNDELQDARKVLIQCLKDQKTRKEPLICVKRMGELSEEPFLVAAKRKFSDEESSIKGMELCSQWEDYMRDPSWHPFKMITVDGKFTEIVDEEDEKLKQLKDEYGDEVYDAVKIAMTEMNEYNPSGRYVVPELWNNEQKRKAKLKEGVAYLLNHWKQLKPSAKRRRT